MYSKRDKGLKLIYEKLLALTCARFYVTRKSLFVSSNTHFWEASKLFRVITDLDIPLDILIVHLRNVTAQFAPRVRRAALEYGHYIILTYVPTNKVVFPNRCSFLKKKCSSTLHLKASNSMQQCHS
jgi:hypothetical protein